MDSLLNPNSLNNLNALSIGFTLLKILYLAGFGLYVAFSFVVVSQIKQMTNTLNGLLDLPLKFIGFIHLALSVIAFLLALVIL